jgi:hypothetical protein
MNGHSTVTISTDRSLCRPHSSRPHYGKCILVGVTSSSAIEVDSMGGEFWSRDSERLQIQVYRAIMRFKASDCPIKSEPEHKNRCPIRSKGIRGNAGSDLSFHRLCDCEVKG